MESVWDTLRTNALLSDGLTNKVGQDARSAGSYGLGHYTAFPASDLQYVLYGGVTATGAPNNVRTRNPCIALRRRQSTPR